MYRRAQLSLVTQSPLRAQAVEAANTILRRCLKVGVARARWRVQIADGRPLSLAQYGVENRAPEETQQQQQATPSSRRVYPVLPAREPVSPSRAQSAAPSAPSANAAPAPPRPTPLDELRKLVLSQQPDAGSHARRISGESVVRGPARVCGWRLQGA
jgi:hypothetical protein